uniref:START domain-containing protein n=1 Tax=Picea sitchensis TaxID=3332 RepID=A9NUT1_PICSI|nr:unknown [Picea sitchensis]
MEPSGMDIYQIFRKPALVETFVDIAMCLVPLWLAVMIGLLVGWAWKPRWAGLICLGMKSKIRFAWTAPPGFGARRLWFAITALTAFPVLRKLWSNFSDSKAKGDDPTLQEPASTELTPPERGKEQAVVSDEDLENLLHMLQVKDKGPAWQQIMNRSTPTMTYQAWRYEPETGPTAYCSRTVMEDVTPELMRDFFWDDDFRPRWDDMLTYFKTLEECPLTGTMIVHWIRKFPFFCSDREYIIGRRIWESGRTYFCVTKGVPYPSVPRHSKPRRVDLYHSSWRIRAVESRKGDGQMTAMEVMLFHNEDMGIPREIAKIGVRQGMWGAVKKVEPGVRAYQMARKSDAPLSRSALMARINTKLPVSDLRSLEDSSDEEEVATKTQQGIPWRWVIVGGAVALACGLDRGVVSKALIFGVARRFGNLGKRRH